MRRGDKSDYTDKQKRQAEHIAESYEDRGVDEREAKSRAWATVNKISGGGKRSGSGRGKKEGGRPKQTAGRNGGTASAVGHKTASTASPSKHAPKRNRKAAKGA